MARRRIGGDGWSPPISRDGVAGLVCLAGALVLLYASRGLPQPALVPIGPGFYPRILLSVTAVLSGILVVADLVWRRRANTPPAHYRLVVLAFAIFAAYVAALAPLGYRAATVLFVAVLQAALEPPRTARRWAVVLVVAVATTAVTYYVFEGYLSVLLPRGRLTGF
jgi:hypothetical protein